MSDTGVCILDRNGRRNELRLNPRVNATKVAYIIPTVCPYWRRYLVHSRKPRPRFLLTFWIRSKTPSLDCGTGRV